MAIDLAELARRPFVVRHNDLLNAIHTFGHFESKVSGNPIQNTVTEFGRLADICFIAINSKLGWF